MLRLTEMLLFLAPFGLFALWWFAGRRLGIVAWPALVVAIVLGGMLVAFGLRRAMPPAARYVPAHLEGGRIVDGHAQ